MTVTAAAFAPKLLAGVVVHSGAVVDGTVALSLAATAQEVTVTAEANAVDTARQTVDSIVRGDEIKSLPLFGRNFLDLGALAPGTAVRDGAAIDPATKSVNYRAVGIAGRIGMGTRVQVDGVDVTDETTGSTTACYSPDSVSEFQLTRSSLDPSTSMTSSGAINVITPSGANRPHGGVFWDYYNQDMGARLQYNPQSAPFHRTRAGATAGGPVVKDKLFWWVGWERHYQQEQAVSRVPAFPQLNLTQGFPVGVRYGDARLDWNASSAVRLFARFHHDWNLATGGSAVSPFQTINWTNVATVGLDLSGAKTTHSFRWGYVNFNNRVESQELDLRFPRTPDGAPYNLTVGTYKAGWNPNAPQSTFQDNFQGSYEGALSQGQHLLRFGFDARRIVLASFLGSGILRVTGTADAAAIAAIARRGGNVQDPAEYPLESAAFTSPRGFFALRPAHGFPNGGHADTRLASFFQDSVKLHRRLSLNLGVRWAYETAYFHNKDVARDPILELWVPGASKMPRFPRNLFAPSLGFVWDLTGKGKTVVRGGFYQAYEKKFLSREELSLLPRDSVRKPTI